MVSVVSTGRTIPSLRAPLTTQLLSSLSQVCTRWPTSSSGGSLSFSVLLLALLLSLWINARRKEVGILLSIGLKQASILGQFITESILIAIPALVSAYFLSNYTARAIGNTVLANVTSGVTKQASKAAQASNLGGGAEVDGFSKTLSSLDISMQTSDFIIIFILVLVLVVLVMTLASINLLRKQPKELLLDIE